MVGTIAGPLAPGASSTLTATITVSSDRTNIGTATGNPTDDTGADIPGQADVTDSDDAVVVMEVEGGCTLTQGYWKNHPGAWPVESLMLGDVVIYTKAELIELLKTPTGGDAGIVLVHQLIAAKLNVENGADPSVVEDIIADADDWLVDYGDTLPCSIKMDTPEGAVAVDLAEILDDYNNGIIGPVTVMMMTTYCPHCCGIIPGTITTISTMKRYLWQNGTGLQAPRWATTSLPIQR